ncbi:hypothetical protein MHPYR_150022 [uncultured Mycobacterium sp.]|uniref:Uncharacterized protein n=1 Tax=uncultured Mycobacterium sp. TaxID=171292 RepID=A0A1Y5P9N7_9MYCO|nr:hypothetical protein MHPYR_150022 [uncultured Mycobacterium sp.]
MNTSIASVGRWPASPAWSWATWVAIVTGSVVDTLTPLVGSLPIVSSQKWSVNTKN